VTAGFPERLSLDEIGVKDMEGEVGIRNEVDMVGANSAVLYGPDGCWVGGYRKTNLFKTDLTWAKAGMHGHLPQFSISNHLRYPAGTGFTTFQLPAPLDTVTLAICNDLNVFNSTSHLPPPQHTDPQETSPPQSPTQTTSSWTLKEGPYELADYCIAQKTNLLILLDAWLASAESVHDDDDEEEHDWHNVNYWAARLRPLWVNEGVEGGFVEDGDITEPDVGEETVVVVCNRFGEENGKSPFMQYLLPVVSFVVAD
jgi:protein N-terminal amidase